MMKNNLRHKGTHNIRKM